MPPRKKAKKTQPAKAPVPKTFTFRIDDALRESIETSADEAGMSASSFVNQFLSDRIGELSMLQRLQDLEKRLLTVETRPQSILLRLNDQNALTTEVWADFATAVDSAIASTGTEDEAIEEAPPVEDEDAEGADENHAPQGQQRAASSAA